MALVVWRVRCRSATGTMRGVSRPKVRWLLALALGSALTGAPGAPAAPAAAPEGRMTWAIHVSPAPSATAGNAATRMEAFVLSTGIRAYDGYPDIDGLYREQANELDHRKREALLHRIQQFMHERAMFAPIIERG